MVTVRRVFFGALLAGAFLALSGCPSPFLAAIKQAIANAPFTGVKSYTFVRQWGNANPQYAFNNPVVKTDTAGFVYVTDSTYRTMKYTGAGALQSTIAGVSSQGPNARIYDMAFDPFGNMYVTTNDTYMVQKYDVNGNLLAQWATSTNLYPPGTGVAISSPRGIGVDSSGNVYVVDSGNHRVVMFNSAGTYLYEWGRQVTDLYPPTTGVTLSSPQGIVVDTASSYVYVLDYYNHRVVEFSIGAGPAATYVAEWGRAGTDLYPPTTGTLMSYPQGIAMGRVSFTTYIYVADTSNNRVLQFTTGGTYVKTWGDSSQFSYPDSIAVDTSGYVYVTDGSSFGGRIQKFDVSSATPTLLATWGGALSTADGQIGGAWGVAFDPSGNIIGSDIMNSRLQKFSLDGTFLAKWGTPGAGAGQLNFPTGITVSSAGKVLVCEIGNHRYQVFDLSGNSLAAVGSSGTAPGQFSQPIGIASDSSGNVYVTDAAAVPRVEVFSPAGYFLRQFGSAGTGDGQFTSTGSYSGNYGIAVDSTNGWVYVSDYLGNRVQKFDLQGNFISKIGSFGRGNGQFSAPIGMTVDLTGNLYVCDMMNHRIQKFDSAGNFITTFGGPGAGNGGFAWPTGISIDSKGNIVVSDYAMSTIQEFAPTF